LVYRDGGPGREEVVHLGDRQRTVKLLGAEAQVVGPEVLAPLAGQVRLVHHEQPGPCAPERLPRLGVRQLLGREEHVLVGPANGCQRFSTRPRRLLEFTTVADSPALRRWANWSSCRAINGETTTVGPVRIMPASS
jgi:hypothetical protein